MSATDADTPDRAVEVGGVRWAYSERGTGPLAIFLHGTLASSAMYFDLITTLRDRYRCVAVDLPGHGRSGFNAHGWTADDVVVGVAALISKIGGPPATLVGLSQGGAVALRVAMHYPRMVDALVAQGAAPDGPGPEAAAALATFGHILETGHDDERRAAVAELQPMFHAAGWVQTHPEQAEQELSVMLEHDRRAISLAAQVPATYTSIEKQLGQITCPALVMWGDEDPRAFWGPRMLAAMPAARLVMVQHAGHHMLSDAPLVCAREIGRFFDEVHGAGQNG
jgi:pimeloyl-ACP methyl ester carboxylesterase